MVVANAGAAVRESARVRRGGDRGYGAIRFSGRAAFSARYPSTVQGPVVVKRFVLLSFLAASACGDGPTSPALDAALERAGREGKVVFLEFGATWCEPCKRLESTTLADSTVRTWLEEHAISLHVDIDESPELAEGFGVRSVPTMVFLRPDRVVLGSMIGYRGPEAFVADAKRTIAGVSALDESAAAVAADPDDVEARHRYFRELLRAGEHGEALEQARAYWQASRRVPAQAGVRLSFFLGEMKELAGGHEPASRELEAWLAAASARLDAGGAKAVSAGPELAALVATIGDAELVLQTAERLAGSLALPMLALSAIDTLLAGRHYTVLVESGVCEPPVVEARLTSPAPRGALADDPAVARAMRKSLVGRAAQPFEALAGVGRESDAQAIAAFVLGGEDDAEVRERLAQAALRAGAESLARRLRAGR